MNLRAIVPVCLLALFGFSDLAHADEPVTLMAVGGAPRPQDRATLEALRSVLQDADPQTVVVLFTGNYSEHGPLPPAEDERRPRVEADLRRHLDVVRGFVRRGGRAYFLPGDGDYGHDGPEAVRAFRAFVDQELFGSQSDVDRPPTAVPVVSCGEPTLIKLSDDAILAILNSQWWMQDFEAHPSSNEGCEFKNRGQLTTAVNDIVKRWRAKRLVFAMHHPLESLGPLGGRFPLSRHLMPPVAGSVDVWLRTSGLVPQHRSHVMYDAFSSGVFRAAQKFGGFTFVSGHERSLGALYDKDQLQIVSGTAGRTTPVVRAGRDEFAASRPGWAELTLGSEADQVRFIDGETRAVLHVQALPPITRLGSEDLGPPRPIPAGPVTSTYAQKDFPRTTFLRGAFFGWHYRDAYSLELEFPVFDLAQEGFRPFSAGGGNQTNSLFLFDEDGGEWTARSTTKDSGRFLPYPVNQLSFVSGVLDDAFTATHPAAAVAVPPLANAIGVYHTQPRLVYIPDQAALAPYRGFISEEVALLERKARRPPRGQLPEELGEGASPVGVTTYDGADDLMEALQAEPWLHEVDQASLLKARLLDILIGDWDRHEDQWRFARLEYPDGTYRYRPVPEDRDQAFAHYDGLALAMARVVVPSVRMLRPFKKRIRGLYWLVYGSRHFDPIFLNQLSREAWMATAREVVDALTDDVIARAMATWPREAYELDGAAIEEKLRGRRQDLLRAAEHHYEVLARNVDVIGSHGDDRVTAHHADDGSIRLTLRSSEADAEPYFDRVFLPKETKEIRLYTLEGDDELVLTGAEKRSIVIRFVSGLGRDQVRADGDVRQDGRQNGRRNARHVRLYDQRDDATIDGSVDVRDRRSASAYRNQYDRKDPHNEPFTLSFLPVGFFNPDDGLGLGGTLVGTVTGFKRSPFAARHTISAVFITATLGVAADYQLFLPNTIGQLDQLFEVEFTTPRFTRNFFGLTNAYVDPRDAPNDRDFYRVRQLTGSIRYGPTRRFLHDIVTMGLQVEGQFIDIEPNDDPESDPLVIDDPTVVPPESLQDRYFVGGRFIFQVDSRANTTYPKRGLTFEAGAQVRTDLTDADYDTSATLSAAVGTHLPLDRDGRVVVTSRARAEGIVGEFQFYFAPTVGDQDLRAFNQNQFAGDFVFAHTTDLRLELFRIRKVLPGNIGIAGSFDHGRAFVDDDLADRQPPPSLEIDGEPGDYHLSAGGMIFWNVFGLFGLQGQYHRGILDDTERVVVAIGSQFANTGFVTDR